MMAGSTWRRSFDHAGPSYRRSVDGIIDQVAALLATRDLAWEDVILTLPIPEPHRSRLAELRTGGFTEAQALEWAGEVEAELARVATEARPRPAAPLAPLVTAFYRDWYGR